jgi:hypothetical protein
VIMVGSRRISKWKTQEKQKEYDEHLDEPAWSRMMESAWQKHDQSRRSENIMFPICFEQELATYDARWHREGAIMHVGEELTGVCE